MKKTILLFLGLFFAIMTQALTVVSTAGSLATAITAAGGNLTTVTDLTVTGTIDARDFLSMRDNMPLLATVDMSAVTIALYTGSAGTCNYSVTYPANELPQNAFCNQSWVGKTSLTSFVMPTSVTSIGNYAFYKCSGLTALTIPATVTSIGNYAFKNCSSLTSMTIPTSVTSIKMSAFANCTGLTTISIPSSVLSIEESTFQSCTGLITINIPASVTSIGKNAFFDCSGSITVDDGNTSFSSDEGVLFNKAKTTLITCPTSKTGTYTIPSTVTFVSINAFANSTNLTTISIPASVTSIGINAFIDCSSLITVDAGNTFYSSVEGVLFNKAQTALIECPISKTGIYTIPSTVTSIGKFAFYDCKSLTSISIPASVTSIGEFAFASCSGLTTISIPAWVTTIERNTFVGCSGLTTLSIPASVTSIGSNAFEACSGLTSIYAFAVKPVDLSSSSDVFKGVDATTCILHVPIDAQAAYQLAPEWSAFTSNIIADIVPITILTVVSTAGGLATL